MDFEIFILKYGHHFCLAVNGSKLEGLVAAVQDAVACMASLEIKDLSRILRKFLFLKEVRL